MLLEHHRDTSGTGRAQFYPDETVGLKVIVPRQV
jgi:hypothetical protein